MPDGSPPGYTPAPFDISDVELDGSTAALVERLAANIHDVWARERMNEGWTFGPARDDVARFHPSLVPFDALPEAEKDIDRAVVRNALLPLLKLGFTITPPESTTATIAFAGAMAATGSARSVREQIASASTLTALAELWRARDDATWRLHPDLFAALAQRLIRMGAVLPAYDAVTEGLKRVPNDLRLLQLQGLALARSGAFDAAIIVLARTRDTLEHTPEQLEETLGILGGAYKSAALRSTTPAAARALYQAAHASYDAAFRQCNGYYSGINAATTALLAGDESHAAELARQVRDICLSQLREQDATADRYYLSATLGEASLLLRDFDQAGRWYARAARVAGDRVADLASTRRNALVVTRALGAGEEVVEATLALPRVGALIVDGGDAGSVLTPAAELRLGSMMDDVLTERDIRFGYSTGCDDVATLFLEHVQGRGATHVVLPYTADELAAERLDEPGGRDWVERARHVIAAADELLIATERAFSSGAVLRAYASQLALGLAVVHAEQLGAELVILSSDLRTMSLEEARHALTRDAPTSDASDASDTRVRSIIFADVVHSSALTDAQQPVFVERFLGAVGTLLGQSGPRPLSTNTWGDGLYLIFDGVHDAGVIALRLRDLVRGTDWAAAGLPARLSLRIGLHAGPIFAYRDPVTGTVNYTGKHTIRAARIEPITAADAVYASREFTALAALGCPGDFVFTPVGQVDLAKHSASVPLFALEWGAST